MYNKLLNLWKVGELRKRVLFTAFILVLFRIGCAIPVPFIQSDMLAGIFEGSNLFAYMNMLTGGALSLCAVFALGVSPYINASIVMQLLTVVFPGLDRIRKEDNEYYQKVMRYTSAGFAVVMAASYYVMLRMYGALEYSTGVAGVFAALVIIAAFTAGSQAVVWLGWQIDDYGLGNGVSFLIFGGIISRWVNIVSLFNTFVLFVKQHDILRSVVLGCLPILMVLSIYFVVKATDAEKRVPIQYARAIKGKSTVGADRSYIPVKIVMSGVMPIIFAGTIMSIPSTIGGFISASWNPGLRNMLLGFNMHNWLYCILYIVLIFAFNYFYVDVQFDGVQMAENLRRNGGAIPGIRPGAPTSEYLDKTAKSVVFLGAMVLVVIAAVPIVLGNLTGLSIQLGGTSLLIVCGVALETVTAMDSFVMARHHKGFLN